MNRRATENLRLDRRLLHRRGWISNAEREKELDSLPDVSGKIAPPDETESEGLGDSGVSGGDETAPGA